MNSGSSLPGGWGLLFSSESLELLTGGTYLELDLFEESIYTMSSGCLGNYALAVSSTPSRSFP